MLQFIRSKASSWIIKILFFGLIISFGVWGIGDIFRGREHQTTVAEVGSTTITGTEYQHEYQRQLKRMTAALGPQFTGDVAKQMGLPQQVLDQLVGRALFSNLADRLGLRAPDDVLRRDLEQSPALKNAAGQFDRARFAQMLQQLGMPEDSFVASLRGDLVRNQIYDSLSAGAVAPKAMADAAYNYRAEKRVADTLFIADSSIGNLPAPDQTALEKFHKDHADRYQAPEYRRLTILRLRPDALAAGIKISDEQIAQDFKARKSEFAIPEKRQLLTFTVVDEAAAKKAAGEIAGGADFAAEAKKASGNDVIETGLVDKQRVLPEMTGPAFSASQGAVVGPVKTVLGWQLAKVVKIEPGRSLDLADVKDQIAKQLADRQAADELISIANQLDDTLAGGASLEDAARKLGLTVQTIPAVARSGADASDKPIADLIAIPQLLPVAFATDPGQVSSQTEDGAGGYFMVRVDQLTAPSLRPLDQVKDKVLADWQADARDHAAAEKAKAAVDRLKAGEDIKTVAESLGITVKRSAPFTRDAGDPPNDVTPAVAAQLFVVKPGEATTAPIDSASNPGRIVAKLVEIQPANPAADAPATQALAQEIAKTLEEDLLAQFRKALQGEIPVTTDPKVAESLI
jgi:peptidyl-prolyl cis-trans isomerase D